MSARPLTGITIVEALSADGGGAEALAIGFAGRIAADLGATVHAATVAPDAATAAFLGAGKRALGPDGRLATLDAILCDAATHAAKSAEAPEAIWVVVSPRGAATDDRPASAFTLAAETGLLDMVGEPDRAPLRLGGHQLAYAAGLAVYGGLAAALCRRGAGQRGDVVRVSVADIGVWVNWKSVAMAAWSDRTITRQGRDAEWRIVRCADGWIALVFRDADWPALREIVGDPRLLDPRYNDRIERRRDAAFIAEVVERAFATRTRAELRDLSLSRRVPLGAVWSPAELVADPQFDARDFLVPVEGMPGAVRPRLPALWRGRDAAAQEVAA